MEVSTTTGVLLCVLFTCLWSGTIGWPTGADLPKSVCKSMKTESAVGMADLEGHLLLPQNYMPGRKRFLPYYMQHNKTSYHPNSEVVVGIVANQTTSLMYYKGILLQAREVVCATNNTIMVHDEPLGSWIVKTIPGKHAHLLGTMDCSGTGSKSAVIHRTPALKIREIVTWKSPSKPVGHIVFWATLVQQGNIHWTGVHSPILLDPRGGKPPGCGAGCLRVPLLSVLIAALSGHLVAAFSYN